MYKLESYNLAFEDGPSYVKRLNDGTIIPFDPANTDYQEYLKWLAEGNEPEPADELGE
tara:strand:- start:488 stop:661 length:174 start_codon:yes stop_codon:yes gene_type:complete